MSTTDAIGLGSMSPEIASRTPARHPYVSATAAELLADGSTCRWHNVDATLAFFDISGFTPMTERLATLGRSGAEHINDVLNVVFTGLIDVVNRFGGDVLEFGGDAMVVLYAGADHERRAASGAAAMFRVMRRNRRLRTPGGTIELGMSCGIASGDQPYYLLGKSRRALVVAGPVSTRMAMLEAAAASGQALVDASTAVALPPSWTTDSGRDGTSRMLAWSAIDVREWPRDDVAARRATDTDLLLPEQFRTIADAGRQIGELKQVAIGFVRLAGTDDVLAEHGPDGVFELLSTITGIVDDAASATGVCWLETQAEANSVRWTLIAGAPTATERDGERLLRVLRQIADRSPSALRIGANLGVVYVGDMGHPERCTYIVMGDTTNLAARLMGRAQPGQIVAGERLVASGGARFERVDLEPFLVKGKRDPVQASVVGGLLSTEIGSVERSELRSRLVGRERELSDLVAAVEGGLVVDLFGPAGVGKSRLWTEASALSTRRWLIIPAEAHDSSSAYLPIRSLVRHLAGIASDAPDDDAATGLTDFVSTHAANLLPWLPLVGVVAGIELPTTTEVEALDETFRSDRQRLVVAELIAAVTHGAVLVFENTHWFDAASRGLIDVLARIPRSRTAIVLTHRPDNEPPPVSDVAIELGPIDGAAAEQLLLAELPERRASDAVLEQLAASSGGNPLYLIELARMAARSGMETGLPETIERLMAARIDELEPRHRALIRDVAVLGTSFDLDLVASVLGRPDLSEPASWVDDWGSLFAVAEGRARFVHDLVRTAAYEGLSVRRRRAVHARAGEVIEAAGDAADPDRIALLAHHATGSDIPERIVVWNRRAGEHALSLGAAEVAETLLDPVIAAQRRTRAPGDERRETLLLLATAAERAGHPERALDALTRASRLSPEAQRQRLAVERARLLEKLGRYRAANVAVGRALRRCDDPLVRARLELSRATVHSFRGEWHDCLVLTRALLERGSLDDGWITAQAHLLSEWCCTAAGIEGATAHAAEAERLLLALDDSIGLANLYLNRGISAWSRCKPEAALADFRTSSERYSRAGDVVGAALADNNVAEILTLQFRLEQAESLLVRARRVTVAADYPLGAMIATSGLSRIAAWRGETVVALALQHEAAAGFERLGADDYVLDSEVRALEIHLLAGDHRAARASLDDARRRLTELGSLPVVPATIERLAARLALAEGDTVDARRRFERALSLAEAESFEYEWALSSIGLARLDGDDRRLQQSMSTLDRLGVLQPPPGT